MSAKPSSRPVAADIASLVSHELVTPIATALLYIGIAECHSAAKSPHNFAQAALSVARAEVQRLKRLVDRVIELERCGHAVIRSQSIDLTAVVRGTVERALVAEGRKVGTVVVETHGQMVGWWDDTAVEQIVRNLLSNAIKFGQDRAVRVMVEPSPEGARILVRDHGVGIRAAYRDRIFERSVRSPPARGGGLGLGLWLVREIATAHGGRVEVQSRVGHGSTFSVWLPEAPPDDIERRPARRAGITDRARRAWRADRKTL